MTPSIQHRCRQNKYLASNTNSAPCDTSKSNIKTVAVPIPVPIEIPVPIHVPVLVPIPIYVPDPKQSNSPETVPPPIQPTVAPKLLDLSPMPKHVEEYIATSKDLDFKVTPRKNFIHPWMDDIEIKLTSRIVDCFCKYMLITAAELGYKWLTQKQQHELAIAVVNRESFLASYPQPVVSPHTFHRHWWLKFDKERQMNPLHAPYVMNSRKGENRLGYVEYLQCEFPTFLHKCYCHATKVLGVSDTAQNLSLSMNEYACDTHSNYEICGSLLMTKWHFWRFFFSNGGKLKRPITKPRLKKEHIQDRYEFGKWWIQKLDTEDKLYYAFLDEKWFYTTSRQKNESITSSKI